MDSRDLPDELLMAQIAAGHAELLEMLVRRYGVRLLTFITRFIGDRHRGEELFQEVFLAVWSKRHQYQTTRPFRPWLYAIAVNKCRELLRRVPAPATGYEEQEPASAEETPSEHALTDQRAALVVRAVQRLPAKQRMVVMLRVWDDLSYAEIAESSGCTESTVRSHMHLALATLRKELERHMV